jgi:hypothetical protein
MRTEWELDKFRSDELHSLIGIGKYFMAWCLDFILINSHAAYASDVDMLHNSTKMTQARPSSNPLQPLKCSTACMRKESELSQLEATIIPEDNFVR